MGRRDNRNLIRVVVLTVLSTTCLMIWKFNFYNLSNTLPTFISNSFGNSTLPGLADSSENSSIVKYIQAHHLTKPSTKEYNLTAPKFLESSYSSMVLQLLGNPKTGVFIEAGAFDGEDASNSLPLELKGWKGILVECNPHALPLLMSKNRKAWIADVCLSTTNQSGSVKLYSSPEWPQSAQINKQLSLDEMKTHGLDWMKNKTWTEYDRPSYPLSSLIEAIGEFQSFDFLSLDVQGAEIDILFNYPFERFPITVILVEIFTFDEERRKFLVKFLETKGYRLYAANIYDYLFVHIQRIRQSFAANNANNKTS